MNLAYFLMQMRKPLTTYFALCLFFCSLLCAKAQHIFPTQQTDYLLLENMQIIADSTHSLRIEQVASADFAEKFEKTPLHTINFGFSKSSYWAKIVLSSEQAQEMWLEYGSNNTNKVSLYRFDSLSNKWVETRIGTDLPRSERQVATAAMLFPVYLSAQPQTFYLKIMPVIPFNIPVVLWKPSKFVEVHTHITLFLGIFWGIMAIMCIYNLSMYLLVGEKSFLLYTLSIFLEILSHLTISGYMNVYFLSGVEAQGRGILNMLVFPLAGLAKFFFILYFLRVRLLSLFYFRLLLFSFSFKLILIVLALLNSIAYFSILLFIFSFVLSLLYVFLGFALLKKLPKTALFFMLSALVHFLGIIFFIVRSSGLITADYIDYQYMNHISGSLAYGIEIVLISIALSNRVNLMKAELVQKEFEKKLIFKEQELKLKYEKDRISKDLHDNIGSQLTLLSKNLDRLKQQPEGGKIENLSEMTQNIMQDLRSMIWVINKEEITGEELEEKITNLLWKTVGQLEGVFYEVKVDFQKEISLTASQSLNLFRITQEALQNAIKYSKAQNIEIQIYSDTNGQLLLKIIDDGIGFDLPQAQHKKGHYGLKNMERRAEEIGGIFKVETEKGKGTKIEIRLPIQNLLHLQSI